MEPLNHDYSNLENRLFDSLDDNAEIKQIKDEAKKIHEAGNLTDEQQTVLLNIITLTNDILINREAEGEKELQEASRIATAVESPNTQSTVFTHAMENAAKIYQDRLGLSHHELFEDLELYGRLSVTRNDDKAQAFSEKLSEEYEGAYMLRNDSDGNCLYRALSTCDAILEDDQLSLESLQHHITPSEENAPRKRALAVKHMEEHSEYYKGIDWKVHERDGVWGEDAQIRALAAAEERPILVLQYNRNQIEGTIYAKGVESIDHIDPNSLRVIVNLGNVHYNALYTTKEQRQRLAQKYNIAPIQ